LAAKKAGLRVLPGSSMNRARIATGLFTFKFEVSNWKPSRLVIPSAPCEPVVKVWATKVVPWVNPKCPGRALIVKAPEAAMAVFAVKRVQRRVTVSTVEEAGVVPLAAVKAVTWTATVCPRWMAAVLTMLAKLL